MNMVVSFKVRDSVSLLGLEKLFIGSMCQVSVEELDLLSLPLVKKAV